MGKTPDVCSIVLIVHQSLINIWFVAVFVTVLLDTTLFQPRCRERRGDDVRAVWREVRQLRTENRAIFAVPISPPEVVFLSE